MSTMFICFGCDMLQAALNTEDPQYQDKRMVAQRNGKLSRQAFHVGISYLLLMQTILWCFLLIFTLFLVQVSRGKEKEAVSEMLPYLRLGYVSDPTEMQSVISSQGPVCPVSYIPICAYSFKYVSDIWFSSIFIFGIRSVQ